VLPQYAIVGIASTGVEHLGVTVLHKKKGMAKIHSKKNMDSSYNTERWSK
jgi:hypothetical protein